MIQDGATFLNTFATIDVVAPDWHMEPLFMMAGSNRAAGA
ncbi:hypothetical protein GCM10007368_05780 [Isoptericola cucumis]|uniref:Uncharacterized protein n=1 Tax=Isoptericola cucumis TaxID=1776856 RepID=A0ABQ2B3J8_9MICO|nr:hypothetical protein GCM10007368_05780 [Isoptericola cucumis]